MQMKLFIEHPGRFYEDPGAGWSFKFSFFEKALEHFLYV